MLAVILVYPAGEPGIFAPTVSGNVKGGTASGTLDKPGKHLYFAVFYFPPPALHQLLYHIPGQLAAIHSDRKGVSLLGYYLIEDLEEMLFFEFFEMLKQGLVAKKCKLCGRYFIMPDTRRRDFCDRIYKDGKTCKEVGGKILYNKRVENDTTLQKYNTEYSKMVSRYYRAEGKLDSEFSGKDMTKEEFKKWSKKAKQALRDYMAGEITAEELLEKIKVD